MRDKDMNLVENKMSKRLVTICEMLRGAGDIICNSIADVSDSAPAETNVGGLRTADVGCDHGYISIYLVQNNISESAIAMDVRKGPLSGAVDNINEYELSGRIETRLSDGLKELKEGEVNSVVIAGMGGDLMKRLLEDADLSALGIKAGVLQPQSELDLFRAYLREKGYVIADEKIVFEDGKYYFPMLVIFDDNFGVSKSLETSENIRDMHAGNALENAIATLCDKGGVSKEDALNICNAYGEHNILSANSLLHDYLVHGRQVDESIIKSLDKDAHAERLSEIKKELFYIDSILKAAFL